MTEGATPLQALFRILIPVSVPGIAAVAIYAFITAWGEVLFASVLTTDETRTLAIGLRNYSSQTNVYWNQLMAAAIVVSAPVVIAFLAAQTLDRARADGGRGEVVATTTTRPRAAAAIAGVQPLVETAVVRDFAPGEGGRGRRAARPARRGLDRRRRPRRRAHARSSTAGRIEDPFYDRNEDDCAWMEEREWWYRLALRRAPRRRRADERLRLVFHGARHLRHRLPQRRGARPPREHVPRGGLRRHRAGCSRARERARDPLRPAAAARGRARPRAVVEHARPSACGCARPSTASAGTGARGCPRSASGARSSCAASGARR